MATPSPGRHIVRSVRRIRISPAPPRTPTRALTQATVSPADAPRANLSHELDSLRLPKAVQATYLSPLKRSITHGVAVCDLQLRSYSVRNLEVFADFALRAAYFLNLPAQGPHPLPRIVERWTVPRSNFVHKKSQENFERVTLRRWIRIFDGHHESVAVWLAFLRRKGYYGVGMKAHVYEHGALDPAPELDREADALSQRLGEKLQLLGGKEVTEREMERRFRDEPFKATWGANRAMAAARSVDDATKRIEVVPVREKRGKEEEEGQDKQQ